MINQSYKAMIVSVFFRDIYFSLYNSMFNLPATKAQCHEDQLPTLVYLSFGFLSI